jgi:streptomycin 6-kinase
LVRELEQRWSLRVGAPLMTETSCAWVAPVERDDGERLVLKLGMPQMEGRDEIAGLRFWNGDPTVRLVASDEISNALLLERCEPGTLLRSLAEERQDEIIASLLRRLWREPESPSTFRPLSEMLNYWSQETLATTSQWIDRGLVEAGLALFRQLSADATTESMLATDLHAGNVVQAQREPWLVIDPKPFVGDRAYDATQHLFNCRDRMRSNPEDTIARFAELLGVERERVRLWTFARAAAEPREDWSDGEFLLILARRLAP